MPLVPVNLDNGGNMRLVNQTTTTKTDELAKEEYAVNYIKAMIALESAIEPYKEQKKELRKEYIEQGWLTKDDIWAVVKAYRLYEKGTDMDDLNDMFEAMEISFGRKDV